MILMVTFDKLERNESHKRKCLDLVNFYIKQVRVEVI